MAHSDRQHFMAKLAAQYGERLRRFLSGRVRNRSDVPDLAQEVFLRLLRVEDYRRIQSPEAYLFTIASHVIQQHAARQATAPLEIDIGEVFAESGVVSGDDPQ